LQFELGCDDPRSMLAPAILAAVRRAVVVSALAVIGCTDGGRAAPDDDVTMSSEESTTALLEESTGLPFECVPGKVRCAGEAWLERCAPTGQEWIPEACPSQTTCVPCDEDTCVEVRCLGPCESVDDVPSSAGCSFIANRQLHPSEGFPDGLVVANPNPALLAAIDFLVTPEGSNQEQLVETVILAPLESHAFTLSSSFVQSESSMFRTGGTHRVRSDVPIVAYHHAPHAMSRGNDSSMLLPESSLRQEYIIPSFGPNVEEFRGEPSYFEVVALENFTTLEWFPTADTAGNGLPIPFVPVDGHGSLKMNRFDTARIAASANQQAIVQLRDLSGTIVVADKPIWVTAGTRCARIPIRDFETYPAGRCDPLQEMPIPLAYWGSTYVAAHSPVRGTERHWWRIYAGTDDITVTADPPQPGTPIVLQRRGDFADLDVPTGTSFVLESADGVFMPVQYLQSQRWTADPAGPGQPEPVEESADHGDPSMYQMIPVAQFLTRYVFSTALRYPHNYVQVIRAAEGAPVVLDGEPIDDASYDPIAEYEVAELSIDEGTHLIESEDPFGIIQVGYSGPDIDANCLLEDEYLDPETGRPLFGCSSSYAYPGGMKSEVIFVP